MVLAALLGFLGVGGSIILVISAVVALYHIRNIMGWAARAATWLRVALVIGFIGVLGVAGLIPGVEMAVDFGAVADFAGSIWQFGADLVAMVR